jgi:hypothetical protein
METDAPREAGEPIMAIVSIKTQQVIFYDADGWIFRATVSTGTTGRGRGCDDGAQARIFQEAR